jgi:hypothetical protein
LIESEGEGVEGEMEIRDGKCIEVEAQCEDANERQEEEDYQEAKGPKPKGGPRNPRLR